jgi:hypothetical protein
MTIKRNFDIIFLNQILLRDKAILLREYDKLNRDSNIDFKCNCGKINSKTFKTLADYSGMFCKECTKRIKKDKYEQTMLKNHGVTNMSKSEISKQKKKETCIKNYGVENPSKSEIIKEKKKQTNIKNRGVDHNFKGKENREKLKKIFIEKYEVEYPMQSPEVREKVKETCIEKYGTSNPLENKDIQNKIKETNLKLRGVEYPLQCKEVMEKLKQTNLRIRGVENPSQCPLVQKKKEESMLTFKEYKCPSGEIRRIQGYENFALDELFKTFTEEQIITDRELIPTINYKYEDENHVYFPDIFIPHLNKIIEVKSIWTYNLEVDKLKQKEIYTKLKGYDYEYWIFDKGYLTVKTEHE